MDPHPSRSPFLALLLFLAMGRAALSMGTDNEESRFWLQDMIWYHGYSAQEAAAGLDMNILEIRTMMEKYRITPETKPRDPPNSNVRIMPWALGRHPRIGFLEGAIDPQRDTKISIFLPWENGGFVVFDLPEAVFSNLGLLFLAHTHIPTIWDKQGISLERSDWKRNPDGTLEGEHKLPNGIAFGAKATGVKDGMTFAYWLYNGTTEPLTGLRSQLCLMLKGAPEFNDQTDANKVLFQDAAAVRSRDGKRWVVTACERTDRTWQNPPVPCIHADPRFVDCAPDARVQVRGRIFFFDGEDVKTEIDRRRAAGTLYFDGK